MISGYGEVQFFTRDHGSWHTGEMIETVMIGGSFDGYRVRYMHLGAIHPELRIGDVVEAGQELGLMGGTAVMESLPHVHIDIEDRAEVRVDVAPLLGLPGDTATCR
jgi:murein DD-endopeptidase MepM/ murein hydrolase activator NlpD